MNAAVITKIEYQLPGEVEFSVFDMVPESGKFNELWNATGAGKIYTTTVNFLIAGLTVDKDAVMKLLDNRKAYFRITDADDLVYLVGSVDYAARLSSEIDLGGAPGSFKGYRCKITQISTTGCKLQ